MCEVCNYKLDLNSPEIFDWICAHANDSDQHAVVLEVY